MKQTFQSRTTATTSTLRPYPVMKDSGVFWLGQVPAHWDVRRNGRLFVQRNETGYPELPILEVSLRTGVSVRNFVSSSRKQVMNERAQYKRARQGDIAYNIMRMWQGAVGVAPVDGLVSPAYVVAQPLQGTNSNYYQRLFRTVEYMNEVNAFSRGIVSDRNRLYWEDFKQMSSAFPPPTEQDAIVRILNNVDSRVQRYIRAKEKLIKLLEEQKQAIIHRAVTRGLDPNVRLSPSGVEWLGEVPGRWEVWQVGQFASVGNGSTPSRGNSLFWLGGTYPWLNSGSVNASAITSADQFVTELALKQCHLPIVAPGSVLVAITGQGKTRGTAALLKFEATINQHIAFITPRSRHMKVLPEFLRLVFVTAYSELRRMSDDSGSTKGALTCRALRHFRIALPPLEEQQRIVNWLGTTTGESDVGIRQALREIELLREYRTRLIADVVTGKLDVREAAARLPDELDEEPVEVEDDEPEVVDDSAEDMEEIP